MNCICKVIFISNSEFCLGSFGALCKISNVKISKGFWSHIFHPISTKLDGKHGNQEIQNIAISGDLPNVKNIQHVDDN